MKATLLACVAVLLLCGLCGVGATNWRHCRGARRNTVKFSVEGCEGRRICNVERGKSYWIEMQFRGNAESSELTASVTGKSRGMSSAMSLSTSNFDSDACNYLNTGCPVQRNELHTYRYPLYIEEFFPTSTYLINYGLKDSTGRVQGCARLVIRIR